MIFVRNVEAAINSSNIKKGSVIYCGGNAGTPQVLLRQLIRDKSIRDVDLLSVLLLGDIEEIFSKETCKRITHRILFNGPYSRKAINTGRASYQLMHLSDVPHQIRKYLKPNVVLLSVSGPDNGGNYSYGTTVEGLQAAVNTAKSNGGLIIAERNIRMPFVLGATLHENEIDFLIDSDYSIPLSPAHPPDERSKKIGEIIAELYIEDGTTLQYGIGEVPEAVTESIIKKGVKDLGIHTELFADAMRHLVDKGIITNKYRENNFSVSSIFLSSDKHGYNWLAFNSSVRSAPSDFTNYIVNIAKQPRMVAINSAIGIDLHGNIWADSLHARNIYSGIGGQADFLRGAYLSKNGYAIIGMKSTTKNGNSKIMDLCPEGITTTAIAADPVILVTEYGAFDPCGLNMAEHAVGIAHLAEPATREKLLRTIYDSKVFHTPRQALKDVFPKGFIPYDTI